MEESIRRLSAAAPEVSVLEWPAQDALRRQMARFGTPRMLLVAPGVAPPELLDDREDWLRVPAEPLDVLYRAAALGRRPVAAPPVVALDDDGLLRVGETWLALSEGQVPVVRLLLDHLDRVVPFEDIGAAYAAVGGSDHPASVRTLLTRLAGRLRMAGLELTTVRRRGVVLSAGSVRAR